MKPHPPDVVPMSHEEALLPLAGLVRDHVDGNVSERVHAAGLQRLQTARATESAERPSFLRRRPIFGSLILVGAAAAAVALGVGVARLFPVALSYQVEAGLVGEGGYIQPATGAPQAIVRFSDGSEVDLGTGGRGRVASTTHDGARIAVENGRASVHVIHRPSTHWSVEAGPFAIQVTGTSFDVQWSGTEQELAVDMHSGSIVLRGPLATEGIAVRGGQRLVASLRDGQIRIENTGATASPEKGKDSSATDAEAAARAPHNAPPAEVAVATPPNDGSDPARAKSESARSNEPPRSVQLSWSKRVASGDFGSVLAEAKERGLAGTLSQAPLAELGALADAARYAGDTDVARRALISQRTRFPTSAQARGAAFLLGRLVEDSGGSAASAIDWYDRYLAESPQGSFASEALGRKVMLVQRTSGLDQARPLAVEYLRRFPRGVYAPRVRELVPDFDGQK